MIKNLIKRPAIFFCLLCFACGAKKAGAQTVTDIMAGIYVAYDSIPYLSFDVKYVYDSDTLLGDFKHEVMDGSFTLAGKKTKYRLGEVDFMQNDSFFIAIYNADKYMIVSDPHSNNTGSELPMRAMIDSMAANYASHYTLTTSVPDSNVGKISFVRSDSIAAFDSFTLTYDTTRHLLRSLEYSFIEAPFIDTTVLYLVAPTGRRKTLRIEFSAYRMDNYSPALYDENSYIFFEDNLCKPVSRYSDYQVFYSKAGSKQ